MAVRAVVLLEFDEVSNPKLRLEPLHVRNIGPAKRIDALVIIAHSENATPGVREQLEPFVLQGVGVLKLVYQQVLKAASVVIANGI